MVCHHGSSCHVGYIKCLGSKVEITDRDVVDDDIGHGFDCFLYMFPSIVMV